MRDEKKMADFIDATVDETLEGLTDLLPPDALAAVRGRLHDDLVAHPVLRALARENAPVEVPEVKTDEGVPGPEALAKLGVKQHG